MDDSIGKSAKPSPGPRKDLEQANRSAPHPLTSGIPQKTEYGPRLTSFAQRRLWFLDQLQPDTSIYTILNVFCLRGSLNVKALEQALDEIRRRHEVLRANFDSIDDEPVQIVAPFQPMPLTVIDYSNVPDDQRDRIRQEGIQTEWRRPFNLKTDPLMRARLLRLGGSEHVLVLVIHHIVSDGWSIGVLNQELGALYDAFCRGKPYPLPDLPIQYADYARWQRQWLQGAVLEKHLSYWRNHLGGSPPVLELPTDRPRPKLQTVKGSCCTTVLAPDLVESLKSLSQRHQATLFMTLLGALQILLSRLSGQDDIVIGTPVAGRRHLETEKLIGFFVNTLALRGDLSGNPAFKELLDRVRSVVFDAMDYQEMPFEKLVEELQPQRSLSHTPLFQVMLNVLLIDSELRLPGLTVEEFNPERDESKFDITLYVLKTGPNLRLDVAYRTDLFDAARIEVMADQFVNLLRQVADSPEKRVQSYSMVTEKTRQFLPDPTLVLDEPRVEPVTSEFLSRAKQFPKDTAVTQAGASWTCEELSATARAIAFTLIARGLEDRAVVALMGPRSFGLVAGTLGVLMSGGVLLTIDRDLPHNRQRLMLTAAQARYLLYVGQWREEDDWLREMPGLEIVEISKQKASSVPNMSLPDPAPNDPAYIFFTSGTTGIPKAVLGTHKGLSHFIHWQKTTFGIGFQDRCAQLTSLSFDVVLRDLFLPLVSGATLCLPDETMDVASDGVLRWMDHERVTVFHAVPAIAQRWLATGGETVKLQNLRWAFFAGEPLTETFVERWRDRFPYAGKIVNFYGPTETTLVKLFQVVPDRPSFGIQPIGAPMPETQALVLNKSGELCGVGEPGEIVIRTPFRTLGYINAPDEQEKRFRVNRFRNDPNDLVYWTGDLGRYRLDGTLEFMGRTDDQVKIRGVRIEPAEIAAVLGRHPVVKASFVTTRDGSEGDNILVAYVVTSPRNSVTATDLRLFLSEYLPAVMVPSTFVFLDTLPLTSNGKVDRRALPVPDPTQTKSPTAFVAPRTPAEHALAAIWCRILKLKEVGVHDNFFDLGGHSLIATQLVSQIRQEFRLEVPLLTIFAKPIIESLALHILEQKALASSSDEIEELLAEVESLSEETAELEFRNLNRQTYGPAQIKNAPSGKSSFYCPSGTSPFFGKRHCTLVILINERFEIDSFERVARFVREFDPTINVFVLRDSASNKQSLPVLPTLTFSPAVIRHPLSQCGCVFAGYPLSKSEEYAALARIGIPVPEWVLLTEKIFPDLSAFDDYVVQKPNYGGMSAEVTVLRKDQVRWRQIETWAAGRSDSMIVQRFIYTGVRPVAYRVNTLFGRALYSIKQEAAEDRPPLFKPHDLSDASMANGVTISATAAGAHVELSFDEEILRLAERAHAAFPQIPLLGFDIVREFPSGKLYVLEANAIGYTWRFDSHAVINGGFSLEEQFDGVRKAAYILAEKTQELAK